jgi:prepilin-type N-terminal cleavage/methylation domain-containing protein
VKKILSRKMGKKRRLDNKGMSLVEVIISITILSIVVIPTLNALTTAMTYNVKARNRQNATALAETIMESFKGYDIDTLKNIFGSNGVSDDGKRIFDASAGGAYAVSGDADGNYVFTITDIKDGNKTYYVEIDAVASNDTNFFVAENMDGTSDAVYVGKKDMNDIATIKQKALADFTTAPDGSSASKVSDLIDEIKSTYSLSSNPTDAKGDEISETNHTLTTDNIDIVSRTIKFEIKTDSATGNDVVTSEMIYSYRIKDFTFYKPIDPALPEDPYDGAVPGHDGWAIAGDEETLSVFPTSGTYDITVAYGGDNVYNVYGTASGSLKRVFICYYPQYDASSDKIEITNNISGRSIPCYVLKQRDKDLSDARCTTSEYSYNVSVVKSGSGTSDIYHNLGINLGDMSKLTTGWTITNGAGKYAISSLEGKYDDTEIPSASKTSKKMSYELTLVVKEGSNVVTQLKSVMNEK